LVLCKLLARYAPPAEGPEMLYALTKQDVARMLSILETVGSTTPEVRKTRTEALRSAYRAIEW
jgi:hypothetical protein